ncbi:transmembrane protein 174 [Anarrhichthys ocellatus]|uniref:transmembrane protein 174 n=1 Tax=Anarrhichthys ocellatus TaxID=433405 RepID=UPI0012EE6C0B|nr:transmembrane protein 174 [Anarrhichthys ocellatus]
MVVQRPVIETDRAGNPTGILSTPPDDPTQVVPPAPRRRQSTGLLDEEKTRTVLLFSGLFLTLGGVTFTAIGWHHYRANPNFEWAQLLGPVLISVGGTFVLTSVCKFRILWPCREWDNEVLVMPVMEQTSTGHSFTLSAVNQPALLYNATAVLCFPPQYDFITQQVRQASEFQPGGPVNGVDVARPPHDALRCVDNAAFTAEEEEDGWVHCAETDCRRSR